MKQRSFGVAVWAMVIAFGLAACGPQATVDGRADSSSFDTSDEDDATPDTDDVDPGDTTTSAPDDDPPDADELLDLALADIEDFWAEQYPATYGDEYEPLEGGFHPYSSDVDPPDCGEELTYEDVAGNAFYCPLSDLIAWDEEVLLPTLDEQFGPLSIALVMAHEFGHAIQARAGVVEPTIYLEQQADCFAGAWTARLVAGESDTLELGAESLDTALAGMLFFSDQPGTPASDPAAHGLGFDRVSAFQDGYEGGADRCATYPDTPPIVLSGVFEQQGQFVPNNLPYREAIPLIVTDLNEYWSALLGDDFVVIDDVVPYDPDGPESELPQCGAEPSDPELLDDAVLYCGATNTIAWDNDFLLEIHRSIGDFGSAILLANQWSRAAQLASGVDSAAADAQLHNDCITGSWVAYVLLGDSPNITLTPDDLDEIVRAFLAANVGVDDGAESGTRPAFDRVQALRTGMLEGYEACEVP